VQAASAQDPFVGRVTERAALAEGFASACAGSAVVCCVEGPAGIGKTALVRAFLAGAASGAVVSASGDEAETTLPWGVLSQLARALWPASARRCANSVG